MNRVGEKGEGESVWLGWFLHATLTAFAPLALARDETKRAEKWTVHADALKVAMEREAWDGDWYRRAYFDDGAALGAATTTSVGSIPSRSPGRCCPARRRTVGPPGRWRRSIAS